MPDRNILSSIYIGAHESDNPLRA